MKKGKVEKFSVRAIADAVSAFDLPCARSALAFAVGSLLEVSGKVQKFAKREGICRLVIEPGDVPGFVVFADCLASAETLKKNKIRKGSSVRVRGKFQSFGASAVCLSDCRLIESKLDENRGKLRQNLDKTYTKLRVKSYAGKENRRARCRNTKQSNE